MKNQISPYLERMLSVFIAAYRKAYGTQHVLIRMLENWKTKLDNDYTVGAILMDLSKAFDCIPHDLLIAKLHAYGFDENSLIFIYSYLKRRKQSARINNVYSNYQTVLSGVPQGSVLGPILFNFYINDLFHFIKDASLVNYADDNTLTYFSNSLPQLINVLEKEASIALTWLDQNEMIANPEKFRALLVKKDRTDTTGHSISIHGKTIKSEDSVKLLGINLDHKLNFDVHISDLCKKAATQLNVLKRLKAFLDFEEKRVLVQSFIFSNFNLVWVFSSSKSMEKIEKIQERALRFLYDDYNSSYVELLVKSEKCTMHVNRLRYLCIEIFKTLKQLNPEFMQTVFETRTSHRPARRPNDLRHYRPNQTTFGSNSLRSLGPQVWNSLAEDIKSAENLVKFKRVIKNWDGATCRCNACLHK